MQTSNDNANVPTYDSLDKIYDVASLGKQGVRYQALIDQFETTFGRKAEFIVRSPGRVNLIGEHIDYCGFGVLPMAIAADVVMAVATTEDDSTVRLSNVNPRYVAREFDYEENGVVTIDASQLEWSNYFKCGYKGMLEHSQRAQPKGMFVLVDGTVPAGSGLSSSAAFVCASALAVIKANDLPLSKQELTEIAIVAERNVGVNSGGMDQSASVFSKKGYALHVDFVPRLSTQLVRLPTTDPAMVFVIANTLVTADKHTTAPKNYNLRVVETRIGALIMAKELNLTLNGSSREITYREVMDAYFETHPEEAKGGQQKQFETMLALVDKIFSNTTGYTRSEMAALAKESEQALVDTYMTQFPVVTDLFRLHQRARHVFSEAHRVVQFVSLCNNPPSDSAQLLEKLACLMNDSQASCDRLFQCSCKELDELTSIAKQHGAHASRLTGAGWGGACVTLTDVNHAPSVIQAMKDNYYSKHYPDLSADQLEDAILCTKPCGGSAIFTINA